MMDGCSLKCTRFHFNKFSKLNKISTKRRAYLLEKVGNSDGDGLERSQAMSQVFRVAGGAGVGHGTALQRAAATQRAPGALAAELLQAARRCLAV